MDEAASGLRLQQESKPDDIMKLDQRIMTLQIELGMLLLQPLTISMKYLEVKRFKNPKAFRNLMLGVF